MIIDINETEIIKDIDAVRAMNAGEVHGVYIVTFGCQQNEADSERLLGLSVSMGYTRCDSPESADLILINTCAIREHAEGKALSFLGRLKALKAKRADLIIGVCGCMPAEAHIEKMLRNDFHYVSFTLEPNMLHTLPTVIRAYREKRERSFIIGRDTGDISEGIPSVRTFGHKAWVSIMYGCNNFCTYCIVPYTRGRERSRPSELIIAECKNLISNGCREITLLGQNVNSYKSDVDFADLVEKIGQIDGDFLIRFMTSHPKDVSDKLISVMSAPNSKVGAYFHLPLQSGSNRILRAMNRTYDRDWFMERAAALRKRVPRICLSTDIIVGFPGEEDSDFLDTLDVLRKVKFDMVYAFKYSPRKGTRAADFEDRIPESVKDERLSFLLAEQDEISLSRNLEYVGRKERVLIDSVSSRRGFSSVDARTGSNKLVHFQCDNAKVGEFRTVEIVNAQAYNLIGKEIKE